MPLPGLRCWGHHGVIKLTANDTSNVVRLRIRAHDLGRFPAEELARRVRAKGFDCVQLACRYGHGMLDYPLLLSSLSAHKLGIAFMLGKDPAAQATACRRFILNQPLSRIP